MKNIAVLKELYDIGVLVNAAHFIEDALNIIIDKSTAFVNVPAGSIALYDAGVGELRIAASKGFSEKFIKTDRWKVRPNSMTAFILSQKNPVVISNLKNESSFNNPIMLEEGIMAVIAIPLSANSRIVGILYIDDFKPREFTADDISFLSLLGIQATFAIEKFQLLKELRSNNDTLLEAKDYLQNVLNDSADIIITTDIDGKIVEFNRGAESILGYKRDEVIGSQMSELYYNKNEREKIICVIESSGSISNYETQLIAKNGKTVDISLTLSQLGNGRGKIIGTVGISKDITEEKRIRREIDKKNIELKDINDRLEERILERTIDLEQANKRLEKTNKIKSQFIANMSHELRTPLNSIIGFSEVLLTDIIETSAKLDEKQTRYVNNILTSGTHLLNLINNILDLAKIEVGKLVLECSKFSLPSTINEIMDIILPLASKKGINLNLNLMPDITEMSADAIKFKQILYNLLSNAIKFTPHGGEVTLAVKKVDNFEELGIKGLKGDSFIKVSVIDTGIGIKSADIDRIFEEFEQLDGSHSRKHEGLGLGLALTKKLVDLHNGQIWVNSQFGQGSEFSFILPAVVHSSLSLLQSQTPVVSSYPSLLASQFQDWTDKEDKAPLVLVVEDDLPTSELITIYLVKAGYAVAHAFDGREAITKAKELKPFAITLDIMLPNKDGWEVLQTLKKEKETQDIPVIINTIIDNKELGFVLGAADYFIKPINGAILIERLNELKSIFKISKQPGVVLFINKDIDMAILLSQILEGEGFSMLNAGSAGEGIELAIVSKPDLIIIDMMFNGSNNSISSFDIVHKLKNMPATQDTPIFLLTEKEMGIDERLKIMGYIDRIIQREVFSKNSLIEEIKKLESLYPKRAGLVDSVTGLFNHRYLNIRLAQEINKANRYKQHCSLIMVGINDFQDYVASNGEFHGNTVLRKMAELVKKILRSYDMTARYGTNTLAILLPNTSKIHTIQLATRFKIMVEGYPFYNMESQPKGKICTSVGIATYLQDANTLEELITAAHKALTNAAGVDKNKVVVL